MGIIGPFLTVILYKTGKKLKINQSVNIFIAAAMGGLFTYCITALQLAIAYPSETGGVAASLAIFLGVFAPTQIPLAIVEGLLTVLVIIGMESFAKKELTSISYMEAY
jgi:cobalt/nickel transport system permease protein